MDTPTPTFAGDLSPTQAWELLATEPRAALVDVRTHPEWVYVGVPDLAPLGKQAVLVSWQVYPAMQRNPAFLQQVAQAGLRPQDPLLMLCRSGVRSAAAAELLALAGYSHCWNVAGGFEGVLDERRHRGSIGGWKAVGLPWAQG